MSLFYSKNENRLRALWRIVLYGFVFMLGSAFISVIAAAAGFLFATASGSLTQEMLASAENAVEVAINLTMSSPLVFFINSAGSLIFIWLLTAIFAKWIDRRKMADFGLTLSGRWWKDFVFGLLLGGLLMTGIFLIEWQLGWLEINSFLQSPSNTPFILAFILMFLSFIAVGIYEELLVRGYQLRNIAEGLNLPNFSPKTALMLSYILTSAWFSFLHLLNPNSSLASVLNLIISGFLLGLGMVLTGRLALPIGLHISWNFFQGTIFGFPVSGLNTGTSVIAVTDTGPALWTGGQFGPEAGLIGLAAMVVGIVLIILYTRHTKGSLSPELSLAIYHPPRKAESILSEQSSQISHL